jgi:hypothetical protein
VLYQLSYLPACGVGPHGANRGFSNPHRSPQQQAQGTIGSDKTRIDGYPMVPCVP